MSPSERVTYFRDFWPAACAANGWKKSDDERRRKVVLQCMEAVGGPLVTTSGGAFGRDEVTALFCYLDFLAHPADLDRSARWADCQEDYHAYNRARQADWYERKAYGSKGSGKLARERFSGARSASGEPLDHFDPKAINKRFVTMASRAQKKERAERQAAPVAVQTELPVKEPVPF
jgi:hypothetical protein